MEHRHLATERREIRYALAARTVGRHQLCDGSTPLRDDDLAPLSHLVEEKREVLAGFADAGSAHEPIVLHVAHGVNRNATGGNAASLDPAARRLEAMRLCGRAYGTGPPGNRVCQPPL